MSPTIETRQQLERLMNALDYGALAEIYCDEGGESFWEDRRGAVVSLGLEWAAALCDRLQKGGRSLYVGAGVAELPALLAEVCDLERSCVVTNLRVPECDSLNASLSAVGLGERLRFEARDAAEIDEKGFDHLSVISVFNDPETVPWVSGVTYGRVSPLDLDVEAFSEERARLRALAKPLCAALARPALVTTTFEEVPWLLEAADADGLRADGDDAMIETALVGDPIGFITLSEDAE